MLFQQKIECEAGQDAVSVVIIFDAPTWADAGHYADATKRLLGLKGVSTVTYAPRNSPAPLSDLLDEDEVRYNFDKANPDMQGQRVLVDREGHRT